MANKKFWVGILAMVLVFGSVSAGAVYSLDFSNDKVSAGVLIADAQPQEVQWTVTVRWRTQTAGNPNPLVERIWATTSREAERRGEEIARANWGHLTGFTILSSVATR